MPQTNDSPDRTEPAPKGEMADADLENVAGGFLGGLIKKAGRAVPTIVKSPAAPSPVPIPYPNTGEQQKG